MRWHFLYKHKTLFGAVIIATCILIAVLLREFYRNAMSNADIVYSLNGNLYLLDVETNMIQQLTSDGSNLGGRWSPDGHHIAFMSSRDDVVPLEERRYRSPNGEIYIIDANGDNLTRLTHNDVSDGSITWSPDGSQLAIISSCDHQFMSRSDVYVMNVDGTNLTNLSNTCDYNVTVSWSPDGSHIVYGTVNDDIFIADVATGSIINLMANNPAADRSPEFSPDGSTIVFESSRSGCYDIYTMDIEGSNLQQVTDSTECDINPIWSPDGRWIAFTSRPGDFTTTISIFNVNDATIQLIHTEESALIHGTQWSPDSRSIIFLVDGVYYRIDIGNSSMSALLRTGDLFFDMDWRP